MICPVCKLDNPPNAISCDCSYRFDLEAIPYPPPKKGIKISVNELPPLWIGYVFGTFVSIAQLGLFIVLAEDQTNIKLNLYLNLLYLPVGLYWFYCIYHLHRVVNVAKPAYPIKPIVAVFGHLLPIYNLYWIYKWPKELEIFLKTNNIKLNGIMIGTVILMSALLGKIIYSLFAVMGLFGILSYAYSKVGKVN